MTDRHNQVTNESEIESMLRQSLPEKPVLSADFEDRVMAAIRAPKTARSPGRRVKWIMMAYWGGAAIFSATLLSGALSSSGLTGLATLLSTLGVIGLLLMFLARQSQIRLSELFMKTFTRA